MNGFVEDARNELRAAYYAKNGDPDLFDKWLKDWQAQEYWRKYGILIQGYHLPETVNVPKKPLTMWEVLIPLGFIIAFMAIFWAIHCLSFSPSR